MQSEPNPSPQHDPQRIQEISRVYDQILTALSVNRQSLTTVLNTPEDIPRQQSKLFKWIAERHNITLSKRTQEICTNLPISIEEYPAIIRYLLVLRIEAGVSSAKHKQGRGEFKRNYGIMPQFESNDQQSSQHRSIMTITTQSVRVAASPYRSIGVKFLQLLYAAATTASHIWTHLKQPQKDNSSPDQDQQGYDTE